MACVQKSERNYFLRRYFRGIKRRFLCWKGVHVLNMSLSGDSEYFVCSGRWRASKNERYNRAATCIYCGRRIYISDEEAAEHASVL